MLSSNLRPITVLRGHKDEVTSLCFLSNEICFSGSLEGEIIGWNISSKTLEYQMNMNQLNKGSLLSLNKLWDDEHSDSKFLRFVKSTMNY